MLKSYLILWTDITLFFLLFMTGIGCTESSHVKETTLPEASLPDSVYIITRLGNGFFSNHFRKIASKQQKYSHIGILVKDAQKNWHVYHSEASELTGIGEVRKEPIAQFLNKVNAYGIYTIDIDKEMKSYITHIADSLVNLHVPFDMDFDCDDFSKLYCTEMVAYTLNKALREQMIFPSGHLGGKKFISIDDIIKQPFIKVATEF